MQNVCLLREVKDVMRMCRQMLDGRIGVVHTTAEGCEGGTVNLLASNKL